MKRALLPLALIALCACPASPPPAPGGGDHAAPPATPGASPSPVAGGYDPKKDPLVNPASLREPLPLDPGDVAEDETLYRTLEGNPANLNPIFISSTFEFYFADLLFTGLFEFDGKMQWRVNEDVVEHFEEAPDHLSYTVKMKPGLTWQDGQPFNAEDVRFSWQQILDDKVPCPAVRSGTDEIVDVQVLDPLTLKMVHKAALATNKWNAGFPIIPKHLYEKDKAKNPDLKTGDYYEKLNRAPIGNGAYKFVEWLANDKIVVERWDGFKGKPGHFKRMVFRIIPDNNVQLLTFSKGEVDEHRMTPKQFATQSGPDSDFAKVGWKALGTQWDLAYICWNMDGSNPFFGDLRVRKAMTAACNTPRMIRELAYNLYTQAYGVFHPDSWMFNPEIKLIPFDLDKAAALLDEAGWKVDESKEGWRYKDVDGKPVRFEFTMLLPQGIEISRDLSAIFQEDLQSIGVKMNTQTLEWAALSERVRKHEFQSSVAAWGTGTDPDTSRNIWLSTEYDPTGTNGRNYGKFQNARVDELYELGRKEFDQAKRKVYYQEIQKIIYDEQPYTFLWNRGTFWAFNKRIRGVTTSPRGVFNFTPAEMAWWVKKSEQKYPAMMP